MKDKIRIQDNTLIGSWEEVQGMKLSDITRREGDDTELDGLVIKGYETKFGVVNENGEMYRPGCLDEFIERYFVGHGFNLTVDVQHGCGVDDLVGRVVYMESNDTGYYFVAYVPRTVARYNQIRDLLKEGILQGFSKCGLATDIDYIEDKKLGEYWLIKKMDLLSVSLVACPANPIPFDSVEETRNRLEWRNNRKKKRSILKSNQ